MIKRNIKTKLVGKEELFKVIALGESMRKPILLIGVPGVAKTQSLLDYAGAMYNYNGKDTRENCFILELDEGTKSSEIKGRVNMEDLLINKKYTIDAPIADASYILINEVDKGSSAVRNTMLSVMREKALFLGNTIKSCKWILFAGSCNEITDDPEDAPFWDRFLIKYTVERVRVMDLSSKVWTGKSKTEISIDLPEKDDINNVSLNSALMNTFLKVIYTDISDRTAVELPLMVKSIKIIWGTNDIESIMKCCEMVCPSKVQNLSAKLEDPLIAQIKGSIRSLPSIEGNDLLVQAINDVEELIEKLKLNPLYTNKADELSKSLVDTQASSQNCQDLIKSLQNKV